MDVRVSWATSVSANVVVQKVQWYVNNELVQTALLTPEKTQRLASQDSVVFKRGDVVAAAVTVNDGYSDSATVRGEVAVPLPPEPVTDLVVELVVK